MNQNEQAVQQAIEDLNVIRRAVESAEPGRLKLTSKNSIEANVILQAVILFAVGGLCLVEIIMRGQLTQFLLAIKHDQDLKQWSISYMAGLLILISAAAYFVVARASQRSGESVSAYASRNFSYLKNLSLISDLFVKFSVISLLLFIDKSELIAPILFLFTGDYLFQGRVISLPIRAALTLGTICFGAGVLQYSLHSPSLLYPLVAFSLIMSASILRLNILKRVTA